MATWLGGKTVSIVGMNSTLIERGPQFFTDGPVTVAIGGETAITHWEMLGHMTADRLPVDSVAHGLRLLDLTGEFSGAAVVSVFVGEEPLLFDAGLPEIPARRILIAEAMASVWRTRIQDIADASAPLYQDAVEELGRLDISGKPHLNELLAQRRRVPVADDASEMDTLKALVHELRQAVVFGAAGFMTAEPDELKATTQKSLAPDGWMHKLSLLVAAEECLATVLLARIRRSAAAADGVLAEDCNFILANRAEDIALAIQLGSVVDSLRDPQLRQANPVKKIISRSTIKMLDGAVHTIRPFAELRKKNQDTFPTLELIPGKSGAAASDGEEAGVPVDAGEEVVDAELIEEFDAGELADAFGELFGQMLPAAQNYAEKLLHDHPRDSKEELESRAQRRFIDLAARKTVDTEHGYLELEESVALYAMTLAVLREVPVDKPAKRQRQAKQLGLAISGYGKLQELPGNKLILNGINAAQRTITAALLKNLGTPRRFPKLALIANLIENLAPTLNDELVANKVLLVVNGGVLKIISAMVEKAIR